MTVMKVFYSREDRMNEFNEEDERVQYENVEEDEARIERGTNLVDERTTDLVSAAEDYIASLYEYNETRTDENLAGMNVCRQDMVEAWAMAQSVLSKLAYILRIDGNEAYHRLMDQMRGKSVTMEGL